MWTMTGNVSRSTGVHREPEDGSPAKKPRLRLSKFSNPNCLNRKAKLQYVEEAERQKRETMQFETEMKRRQAEYAAQLDLQKDREMMMQKEELRKQRRHEDEESVAR